MAVAGHSELDSSLRQLHVVGPIQQDQIRVLLQMWVTLLPELRSAAAATCPVWVAKKVPDDSLQHSFDVAVGRIGAPIDLPVICPLAIVSVQWPFEANTALLQGDGARGTGGGDMDSPATEAVHADGSKAADNAFDPEDITNPFCKNPFEAEAPSSPALDTSNPFKADDRVSNTSSDPFADESDDETPGAPPVFGASSSNPFGCFDGLNPFVDGASMRHAQRRRFPVCTLLLPRSFWFKPSGALLYGGAGSRWAGDQR